MPSASVEFVKKSPPPDWPLSLSPIDVALEALLLYITVSTSKPVEIKVSAPSPGD